MVDTTDLHRLEDCRNELHNLLKEERLTGATLLIFANKQDLAGSMAAPQLQKVLPHQDYVSCTACLLCCRLARYSCKPAPGDTQISKSAAELHHAANWHTYTGIGCCSGQGLRAYVCCDVCDLLEFFLQHLVGSVAYKVHCKD